MPVVCSYGLPVTSAQQLWTANPYRSTTAVAVAGV
jgi:hypothetical protein